MSGMVRDDLLQRLRDFDEEVSLILEPSARVKIVIVGGGALVLMGLITRATHDIDVLKTTESALKDIMADYDMNTRVLSFEQNFPYNYEDRLIPVADVQGERVDFFTASLEDIVIAKLYSARDTDYSDLTSSEVLRAIDWKALQYLATSEEEAKRSALSEERYREFLHAFKEYERRFRPCEN